VRLAHEMALQSPHIIADMVDASEFPDLAGKYNVYGVPKSVVNGKLDVTGAVPENQLLKIVLDSAAS
jgi:protein-disulfide isomerase